MLFETDVKVHDGYFRYDNDIIKEEIPVDFINHDVVMMHLI